MNSFQDHFNNKILTRSYVSGNLVICCTAVRILTFDKACSRCMTLKVIQGHWNCLYSIGHILLPISGLNNDSIRHQFRDITTFTLTMYVN